MSSLLHHPFIGAMAPLITGITDHAGHLIQLDDLHGRKVLLFFHPRDHTEGCLMPTIPIVSVPDDILIVAISLDGSAGQRELLEQSGGQFISLTDDDGTVCRAYGFDADACAQGMHHTFLITADGHIAMTWSGIDTCIFWEKLAEFIAAATTGHP